MTLRAILERGIIGLALLAAVPALLSLGSWFIPHLTEGILPSWFVDPWRDASFHQDAPLGFIHVVVGTLLGLACIAYLALWALGRIRPTFLDQGRETATTAFAHWVLGWFSVHRDRRLRFRDALIAPRLEFAASLAIGITTALATFLPGAVGAAFLALHRVNAGYLVFLAGYAVVALVARRRTDSPYPTVIQDGRLVRRDPDYA